MRAPTIYNIGIEADGKWSAIAGHPGFRGALDGDDPVRVEGYDSPREALEAVIREARDLMLREAKALGSDWAEKLTPTKLGRE